MSWDHRELVRETVLKNEIVAHVKASQNAPRKIEGNHDR
jgi:hypothetical protein